MARILKGTRARGLPPKVLLSRRQDATGSFPTVWRTASDNRTGKYPVSFNDNKIIPFNQPVTDVGFYVDPVFLDPNCQYEEKVVTVGSLGNPVNFFDITFDQAFISNPTVVITELTSNPNTPTVNPFIKEQSATGSYISFSAPFEGTFVYRAMYGTSLPTTVVRSPRYNDRCSLVVRKPDYLSKNVLITFPDFGSPPIENYVTFYDDLNLNEANITSSIFDITNTSVQITASATATDLKIHYMGFGDITVPASIKGIAYPLGMTQQAINSDLSSEDKSDLFKQAFFTNNGIINQPIVASGSMKKGLADTFVTFTPGQDIEPFMDFANPEVDGKVSASVGGVNPFYATGSAVTTTGLGFQQPLWSKNKIEIDITPASVQSFTLFKSASVGSYPMGYWNPNTKLYEGIGTGKGIDSYSGDLNGLKKALEEQTFGYTFSNDNGSIITGFPTDGSQYNLYARQTSTYGFPYHPKFQPTSSQQILASNFISEPFLLEKIVLEISGSAAFSDIATSSPSIWTFFLLNSRQVLSKSISKEQNVNYTISSPSPYISFTTSSILNGNMLDVVDTIQVSLSGTADINGYLNREQLIKRWPSISIGATGSFQLLATSTIKSAISYNSSIFSIFSGSSIRRVECILNSSGRNQYYESNGRDWINTFENPKIIATGSLNFGGGYTSTVYINDKYAKSNPYILLPTDKLTFGFQLPYEGVNTIDSNTFTFSTMGINKIVLYGSTLRLNPETNQLEEHHDTLNQLLCSNSVHEIIG